MLTPAMFASLAVSPRLDFLPREHECTGARTFSRHDLSQAVASFADPARGSQG